MMFCRVVESGRPEPPWASLGLQSGAALLQAAEPVATAAGLCFPGPGTDHVPLAEGEIHEVVERTPSAGGQLIMDSLLGQQRRRQGYTVLLDSHDRFDPASPQGKLLDTLLWVRRVPPARMLAAADLVLRDDTFGLVILDWRGCQPGLLRSFPLSSWYRLQGLGRQKAAVCVVFTPEPGVPCAQTRIELTRPHRLTALEQERTALLATLSWQTTRDRRPVSGVTRVA